MDNKLVMSKEIPAEEERMLMLLSNSPGVKALRWLSESESDAGEFSWFKASRLGPAQSRVE